jgi:hypothetical protein
VYTSLRSVSEIKVATPMPIGSTENQVMTESGKKISINIRLVSMFGNTLKHVTLTGNVICFPVSLNFEIIR